MQTTFDLDARQKYKSTQEPSYWYGGKVLTVLPELARFTHALYTPENDRAPERHVSLLLALSCQRRRGAEIRVAMICHPHEEHGQRHT